MKLLDAKMIDFFNEKYAFITMMPLKKDIYKNQIKKDMQ